MKTPGTDDQPKALLLTDREAAALCGLGRSTWRRLQAGGKVPPPIHLGRSCRWRRSELLAWIDAGAPEACTWAAMREQHARRYLRATS
jgi:predicted DNA-binding transcriptional regulator AlpA